MENIEYIKPSAKKSKDRRKSPLRRLIIALIILAVAGVVVVAGLNLYVVGTTKGRIVTPDAAQGLGADCVLVLGAGVRPDGSPSDMLRDRLDGGIKLYKAGVSDRLLLSGDHGQTEYDEVNCMRDYALDAGLPSHEVFLDHAGFSTYESLYRARDIFQVKSVVIVTQEYHLYRALFIARSLGLEAWGVAAEGDNYAGQTMRDLREAVARCKDVVYCIFKPFPTYLGDAIPIWGDGNLTLG